MFALVERYPNIDVINFYALASTILAAMLYCYHKKQV